MRVVVPTKARKFFPNAKKKEDTPGQSLLAKALSLTEQGRKTKQLNHHELDLIEAWLDDRVTLKQVAYARGNSNIYAFLAVGAREIFRERKKQAEGRLIRETNS
jgi:hypothetical protein